MSHALTCLSFIFLHRKLDEVQIEVGRLHKEVAHLHSTVNSLESQVIALNFEKTDLEDENLKQQFDIKLKGRILKKVNEEILFKFNATRDITLTQPWQLPL